MMTTCKCCGRQSGFRWTDTHGIAVCTVCGLPHRLYFYDNDDRRIDGREPECVLTDQGVNLARRYWQETTRMVLPGEFDMGVSSRRGGTYSGATEDDMRSWDEWYAKQPEASEAEHTPQQEGGK